MSDLLQLFDNWTDTVEYPAGTVVLSEKKPSDELFVLLDGEVELSLRGKLLGKETAGGIIGEIALTSAPADSLTARAGTDVRLARVSRERFYELIAQHPRFSQHALLNMVNRLRAANAFISTQLESNEE